MTDPEGSNSWFNQRWYDYTGTVQEDMRDHMTACARAVPNRIRMGNISPSRE
jgi:hypothetical protein